MTISDARSITDKKIREINSVHQNRDRHLDTLRAGVANLQLQKTELRDNTFKLVLHDLRTLSFDEFHSKYSFDIAGTVANLRETLKKELKTVRGNITRGKKEIEEADTNYEERRKDYTDLEKALDNISKELEPFVSHEDMKGFLYSDDYINQPKFSFMQKIFSGKKVKATLAHWDSVRSFYAGKTVTAEDNDVVENARDLILKKISHEDDVKYQLSDKKRLLQDAKTELNSIKMKVEGLEMDESSMSSRESQNDVTLGEGIVKHSFTTILESNSIVFKEQLDLRTELNIKIEALENMIKKVGSIDLSKLKRTLEDVQYKLRRGSSYTRLKSSAERAFDDIEKIDITKLDEQISNYDFNRILKSRSFTDRNRSEDIIQFESLFYAALAMEFMDDEEFLSGFNLFYDLSDIDVGSVDGDMVEIAGSFDVDSFDSFDVGSIDSIDTSSFDSMSSSSFSSDSSSSFGGGGGFD